MTIASDSTVAIIAAVTSLIVAVGAMVAGYLSRRTEVEATQTQGELADFTILRGVVDALNLEVERLTGALSDARHMADQLNVELEAARANVRILVRFCSTVAPEHPLPKLRPMHDID